MTAPPRPYKFLDAYTSDDKNIFFGRDRETRVLVTDITVNRLVVLFARTGTGKTSLINAGARPRLESNGFETFFIRVNQDPVASARDELIKHHSVKKLAKGSLAEQLVQLVQKLQRPIVLFFDQFEEFFIYVQRRDPQRGRDFIADVARLYRNPESGVHFVFSMREEFFVEMDAFRDEIPSIFHNESNLRLRRFDRKEAYEAIVHPARVFDVRLDADLVEQMLDDLAAAADAAGAIEPAQLQIVCDALWDHQTDGRLTLSHYHSLGNSRSKESIAQQILYKRLEDAFARIESRRQLELLETMLGELRTKQGTKWVRDVEGLKQVLTTGSTEVVPGDVDELLRILEKVRFIRRSTRDSLEVIELSHDYLVDRIDELQRRVRLIWPRRILRNVTRASELLPSRADLAAIADHARDLEITAEQALLLFAAALGQTAQPELWFHLAVAAGADPVKQLIEMIDDDQMPLLYSQLAIRLVERLLQSMDTSEEEERLFAVLDLAVQNQKTTLEAQEALVRLATTGGIPIMTSTSKRVEKLTYDRIDSGRLTPSAITWIARNSQPAESLRLLERALSRPDLAGDAQAALLGLAHEWHPARDVLFSYLRQQLDGSAAQVAPATIRALALLDDPRVIVPLRTALRRHPTLALDAKVALERAASSINQGIASAARRALSAGIDEGSVPSAAALPVDEERVARNFGASGSHDIDLLADLIQQGQCIIVAGAGIHAPSPRGRGIAAYEERRLLTSELTLRIAKWCHYESRESTSSIPDFRRVMQFAEARFGREALNSRIESEIRGAIGPSPLLAMLARLPVRTWITTNYDLMIEAALTAAGRRPYIMRTPERFTPTGIVEQPLLVKLHGDIDTPNDVVLTEENLVHYILNLGDSRDWLYRIVGDGCLLLLGWNYRNLENRFILRALSPHESTIAFVVDPAPEVFRQSQVSYSLRIIEDDLWSFVPRLLEACGRMA